MTDSAESAESIEQENPPLQFGARRVYYQYSVALPQIHLVLISILQGVAFGVLLLKPIPFPTDLHQVNFGFFEHHYFYVSYIITSLVILLTWMDFVYASAVLIWPPTALQAALVYLLTWAEVGMANTIDDIHLWIVGLGIATIIGGIIRCNNNRLFREDDFEDHGLGRNVLRNELIYGMVYILLGCIGVSYGFIYDNLYSWMRTTYPDLSATGADRWLHWISFSSILLELAVIFAVDIVYRQRLLRRLMKDTNLQVTRQGGLRHKRNVHVQLAVAQVKASVEDKLSTSGEAQSKSIDQQNNAITLAKSIEQGVGVQNKDQPAELKKDMLTLDDSITVSLDRMHLYHLWEKGYWLTQEIDWTQDRVDWHKKLSDEQRRAIRFYTAMFLNGEEAVTAHLPPFIAAISRYEEQVFLATQIADEARHYVFFDQFLREVVEVGSDMSSRLSAAQPYLNANYKQLFDELKCITNNLRQQPNSTALLAQSFALYHLVIEGLAHAGQQFLCKFGTDTGLLPGFTKGMQYTARDESRHIAFGLQRLRELVTTHPECKSGIIDMLNRILPWAIGVFFPSSLDLTYLDSLGISTRETCTFIIRTFESRLQLIGIAPDELLVLAWLGYPLSPEEQMQRLFTLMMSGIFSGNKSVQVTEEVMEIIFSSMCNSARWARKRRRRLQGRLQWIFSDAQPRYIDLGAVEVRTGTGMISNAQATIQVSAADWARIATGSLHPLWVMINRQLSIKGNWLAVALLLYSMPSCKSRN